MLEMKPNYLLQVKIRFLQSLEMITEILENYLLQSVLMIMLSSKRLQIYGVTNPLLVNPHLTMREKAWLIFPNPIKQDLELLYKNLLLNSKRILTTSGYLLSIMMWLAVIMKLLELLQDIQIINQESMNLLQVMIIGANSMIQEPEKRLISL